MTIISPVTAVRRVMLAGVPGWAVTSREEKIGGAEMWRRMESRVVGQEMRKLPEASEVVWRCWEPQSARTWALGMGVLVGSAMWPVMTDWAVAAVVRRAQRVIVALIAGLSGSYRYFSSAAGVLRV
nr:hypothetical protein [Granulicella tundricola]